MQSTLLTNLQLIKSDFGDDQLNTERRVLNYLVFKGLVASCQKVPVSFASPI